MVTGSSILLESCNGFVRTIFGNSHASGIQSIVSPKAEHSVLLQTSPRVFWHIDKSGFGTDLTKYRTLIVLLDAAGEEGLQLEQYDPRLPYSEAFITKRIQEGGVYLFDHNIKHQLTGPINPKNSSATLTWWAGLVRK